MLLEAIVALAAPEHVATVDALHDRAIDAAFEWWSEGFRFGTEAGEDAARRVIQLEAQRVLDEAQTQWLIKALDSGIRH